MKLAIVKEHRDFFQKQGFIEFENFLTQSQLKEWNQAIDQALASRLEVTVDSVKRSSAEKLFLQSRDLWRTHEPLKKLVCQPRYAKIASELVEAAPIRLGYDQFFPVSYEALNLAKEDVYTRYLQPIENLESRSCLRGVLCGLMLALGPAEDEVSQSENLEAGIDVFPHPPGHAIFFQPQAEVNWNQFYQHAGQRFFLIVYTQLFAYYELQPKDPHTHALKHLGYIFNDKLSDRLNPTLYR